MVLQELTASTHHYILQRKPGELEILIYRDVCKLETIVVDQS